MDVVTTAYENIINNHYTGLIFLDLKKAFDIVNHNILLSKLNHYARSCAQLTIILPN